MLPDKSERVVAAKVGDSLLDVAQEHDIDIEGACGGEMACSTCHVILEQDVYDSLEEPEEEEEDMLDLALGLTETCVADAGASPTFAGRCALTRGRARLCAGRGSAARCSASRSSMASRCSCPTKLQITSVTSDACMQPVGCFKQSILFHLIAPALASQLGRHGAAAHHFNARAFGKQEQMARRC